MMICNPVFSLVILLLASYLLTTSSVSNNFPPTQLQALHDLYLHTNGAYWTWQSIVGMWNFDEVDPNPCLESWQGIGCSSDCMGGSSCTVRNLTLSNYNLTGSLPLSIGNLSGLISIDLDKNRISGNIPWELGKLKHLRVLNIQKNTLHGTIPHSLFNCTNMTILNLLSNNITGTIPNQFGLLTRLKELKLGFNSLQATVPTTLIHLQSLQTINLQNLNLTGNIFEILLPISSLQEIIIGGNHFNGTLPITIGTAFPRLHIFIIDNNYFRGRIPPTINLLTQLKVFTIMKNFFEGSFPLSLCELSQLEVMDIGFNFFNGTLPEELQNLQSLHSFSIVFNYFTGTLPNAIWSLTALQRLDLSFNIFHGTLSNQIGTLHNITHFNLVSNFFTGSIPISLGNLHDVQYLYLSNNSFNGTIPHSIGNLTQVKAFHIENNYLTGTVPESISRLYNAKRIYLYNNSFEGTLPANISLLTKLQHLSAYRNHFTGTIPKEIFNCTDLQFLGLNNNLLSGTIPPEVGKLTKIVALFFYDNQLTGTMPQTVTELTSMRDFEIEHNFVSGTIPEHIGNMKYLVYLGLNGNLLTGTLPSSAAQLTELITFTFEFNFLTGSLSSSITHHWPKLQITNFENNFLMGSIDIIANWNKLVNLNMSTNFFSGSIFNLKTNFTTLTSFDISNNKFSSSLGTVFNYMSKVTDVNLAHNQFTGNLNNAFSSQQQLQLIDVSDNQFTGRLPTHLFQLPSLLIFAAVKNCFTGSLPTNSICASTSLTTLALDGLHTAEACQDRFFPGWHSITSYQLESSLEGGLAGCLFNMSGLKTLHLSGNGITGTIPSMRSEDVGSRLSDVSLSYNQLTGSIPSWMQERRWKNLDVSFNKLNGVLESGFAAAVNGSTLKMTVNRLSGEIPSSLLDAEDIDMLQGNIFRCDKSETLGDPTRQLPSHDEESKTYECGSDSVNTALVTWVNVSFVLLGLFFLYVGKVCNLEGFDENSTQTSWQLFKQNVRNFYKAYFVNNPLEENAERNINSESGLQLLHIEEARVLWFIRKHLTVLRKMAWLITAFSTVILLPTYSVLADYYGTHEHTYTWGVSIGFLSGFVPSIILFSFFIMFYIIVSSRVNHAILKLVGIHHSNTEMNKRVASKETSTQSNNMNISQSYFSFQSILVWQQMRVDSQVIRSTALFAAVIIVDIVIVVAVNSSYVYITTLHLSQAQLFFVEVTLSLFKIAWSEYAVLGIFSRMLHDAYNPMTKYSDFTFMKTIVLAYLTIFNNIIATFLAAAFVDPNCFLFVIQPQESVTAIYSKNICYLYAFHISQGVLQSECYMSEDISTSTLYEPPFIYSFQCTSALLSRFVNIFIYRYLITGLLFPFGNIAFQTLSHHIQMSEFWKKLFGQQDAATLDNDRRSVELSIYYRNSDAQSPMEHNPMVDIHTVVEKREEHEKNDNDEPRNISVISILNKESFSVSLVGDFAVLLTFGLAFSPLALIITVSIVVTTVSLQIRVANLIKDMKKQIEGGEAAHVMSRDLKMLSTINSFVIGSTYQSAKHLVACLQKLEIECEEVIELFRPTIPSLALLSSIFIGSFLFDILGDDVGVTQALWILLVMGTIPSIIWVVEYVYEYMKEYWTAS